MKINLILILVICVLNSCKLYPSKKELLNIIHEKDYLFKRPILISFDQLSNVSDLNINQHQSFKRENVEITLEIPIDSVTENNIQITGNQISIIIPAAKTNANTQNEFIRDILKTNTSELDILKNNMQKLVTSVISKELKTKGFKIIKIKFNA